MRRCPSVCPASLAPISGSGFGQREKGRDERTNDRTSCSTWDWITSARARPPALLPGPASGRLLSFAHVSLSLSLFFRGVVFFLLILRDFLSTSRFVSVSAPDREAGANSLTLNSFRQICFHGEYFSHLLVRLYGVQLEYIRAHSESGPSLLGEQKKDRTDQLNHESPEPRSEQLTN